MYNTKRKLVSSFFFDEIENSHIENSWYRTFDTYFVFEEGLSFRLKSIRKMKEVKYVSTSFAIFRRNFTVVSDIPLRNEHYNDLSFRLKAKISL